MWTDNWGRRMQCAAARTSASRVGWREACLFFFLLVVNCLHNLSKDVINWPMLDLEDPARPLGSSRKKLEAAATCSVGTVRKVET